jgi:hypothetical protein
VVATANLGLASMQQKSVIALCLGVGKAISLKAREARLSRRSVAEAEFADAVTQQPSRRAQVPLAVRRSSFAAFSAVN